MQGEKVYMNSTNNNSDEMNDKVQNTESEQQNKSFFERFPVIRAIACILLVKFLWPFLKELIFGDN